MVCLINALCVNSYFFLLKPLTPEGWKIVHSQFSPLETKGHISLELCLL